MKFKHFTMKELEKMTQDQQRGYVLAEITYGLGEALVNDMKQTEIAETLENQMTLIAKMKGAFEQASTSFRDAMTEDTEKFEEMLQHAVDAPQALNYE